MSAKTPAQKRVYPRGLVKQAVKRLQLDRNLITSRKGLAPQEFGEPLPNQTLLCDVAEVGKAGCLSGPNDFGNGGWEHYERIWTVV